MAQQFINIFDDTVLKQSVNQGYEVQRTNSRLGKFTMGELAFTRDTGRLFVGNYTNLDLVKDSGAVTGGTIVGNKYLGLIDSKPLTHYYLTNETGEYVYSSVHLPLNYESDTKSKNLRGDDGVIKTYTEKALLKKDSKFRTDKNNGWDKNSNYNESYDAYDGDFLYDAFNNAFILFDKKIKPVSPTDDPNWVIDGMIQKFENSEGSYYGEEGLKNQYSKYRTRFQNVQSPSDNSNATVLGNPNYPIYGDGYVVMRVVEPDGITLGYREKNFNQSTGKAEDGNYSHNYIELKSVPANLIFNSLDSSCFALNSNNKIVLSDNIELSGFTISGESITLPNVVNITNGPSFTFSKTNDSTGYVCVLNNSDGKKMTQIKSGPYISLVGKTKTTTQQISPTGTFTFNLVELLEDTEDDDSSTTVDQNKTFQVSLPFRTGTNEEFYFSGSNIYSKNGNFISFERIPTLTEGGTINEENPYSNFILYDSSGKNSTYTITQETATLADGTTTNDETYYGQFEHTYLNTSLNYVKTPEPIAWGNGSGCAQFFIDPYLISPPNFKSGSMGTVGTVEPSISDTAWQNLTVYTSEIALNFDLTLTNLMGISIPEHAASVICEFHMYAGRSSTDTDSTNFVVTTATHWEQNKDAITMTNGEINWFDWTNMSISSVPSTSKFKQGVKILKDVSIAEAPEGSKVNQAVDIVEFPLYRDKNGMKYFNFGVFTNYSSAKWVMRAIGYRA